MVSPPLDRSIFVRRYTMGTALLAFEGRSLIGRKLLLGQRLRRDDGKSLCMPLSLGPGHFRTENGDFPAIDAFSISVDPAPSIGHLNRRSRAKSHRCDHRSVSRPDRTPFGRCSRQHEEIAVRAGGVVTDASYTLRTWLTQSSEFESHLESSL